MKLKARQTVVFFEMLCHLCSAGFTLRDALGLARRSTRDPVLEGLFDWIRTGLERGQSFSGLLEASGAGFRGLVLALVKVAEEGGSMSLVLGHIHEWLVQERRMRDQIRAALIYPCMVLVSAFAALGLIGLVVLPAFSEFSTSLGGDTAARTQAMFSSLGLVCMTGLAALLTVGLGIPAWILAKNRMPGLASWQDRMVFGLPLLGTWKRLETGKDCAFALELLCRSGMSLPDSLRALAEVWTNRHFKAELGRLVRGLEGGKALSALMAESRVFPPEALQWVALGERSGKPAEVFHRMHLLCRRGVESLNQGLQSLIEPVMTLVMGVFMTGFVLFFVVPILNFYGGSL